MTFLNAIYMSCISVVTVGYGDFSPMNQISGNVTSCYADADALAAGEGSVVPACTVCPCAGCDTVCDTQEGQAVCTIAGVPDEYNGKCNTCMIIGLFWVTISVVIVGQALGAFVDYYLMAKTKAAQAKVLAKKLTIEDLIKADDDESGTVTKAEFILFKLEKMGCLESEMVAKIQQQFNNVDTDGSGVLTFEDIEAALAAGTL
jgi:hypothetical protein